MISTIQLRTIMPGLTEDAAAAWISPINGAIVAFGVDQTIQRQAMFFAQVAHESLQLHALREIWGPTPEQLSYEPGTKKAADLGNTEKGDGFRFRGRGLIQVTGRGNYEACSIAVYGDARLLDEPELLEEPYGASQSAAWFWQAHGLNILADAGRFEAVTRVINGGTNGMNERLIFYARARTAFGMQGALTS